MLLYSHSGTYRAANELRFGEIFFEIENKADMSANITRGYRATSAYPIYPSVIIDVTFAPSLLTLSENAQGCNVVTATKRTDAALLLQQKIRSVIK
jgi:hypothetical protein